MPSPGAVEGWESYLTSIGGALERSRRLPDQLQVCRPENAGAWDAFDAHWWDYCEAMSTCLKRTRRGDRAFVYESGEGITAVVDFQGDTFWLPDWGYVAPGLFRPLRHALPRDVLARRAVLTAILRRGPVSGQNLSPAQAEAIGALLSDPTPAFMAMPQKRCNRARIDWFRADREWGLELPMRDAVLGSREWRKLFRTEPRAEVRSADAVDRYDLISEDDRAVAEFKLAANSATLVQLDRYLRYQKEQHGGRWTGHIVWGNSCSRVLADRVAGRRDIRLWRCDRRARDRPVLVEQ